MLSTQDKERIKCYLSKDLKEKYLTEHEKEIFLNLVTKEYTIPYDIYEKYINDTKKYFEKIDTALNDPIIKGMMEVKEGKKSKIELEIEKDEENIIKTSLEEFLESKNIKLEKL